MLSHGLLHQATDYRLGGAAHGLRPRCHSDCVILGVAALVGGQVNSHQPEGRLDALPCLAESQVPWI